jgi:UDP-N-acetylglucosamine--N-acetylmuramyl-(pentapeptide) pyrophosphoryl-undecaprenol N-acetylglucosamine transferase
VGRAVLRATRTSGRRAFGIDPNATVVLVAGGSQGARSLNLAAVEAFGDAPPFELIHVAGPRGMEEVRGLLAERSPGPRYRLFDHLTNFPEAMAAADLVVSRSGGSVFEITAIGRPAILVPYPHATGDHQAKNAAWLAGAGAAVTLPDGELSGRVLRDLVGALLMDRRRLGAMADASRALGRPEAAGQIAEAALELARRPRGRGRARAV